MKTVFILVLSFVSLFSVAGELNGHYRGLLKFDEHASIVMGIEIKGSTQDYELILSSPNQRASFIATEKVVIDGNQISFSAKDINATFNGEFVGNKLIGTLSQARDFKVELNKLTQESLALLENEGSLYGNLNIAPSNTLALVLNVAVLQDAYHVTLDSPKQQSFFIPVDKFTISGKEMTFRSSLINANYSATYENEKWKGTFVQGAAMPLIFEKKSQP